MIAAPVLAAEVEKGFTYYVAPGGSDAAAGTKAAPFATVDHAAALLGAGQGIGVYRGGKYRLTPQTVTPTTAASINLTAANQRIGAWGSPALGKPIITGGKVLNGFSSALAGGMEPVLGAASGGGVAQLYALAVAPVGEVTPTVAQSAAAHTNATSATATLGATPTKERKLICAIKCGSSAVLTPPVGFTKLAEIVRETGRLWIGTRTVVEGDGKTVKGEVAPTGRISVVVAEITGWGGVDSFVEATRGQSPYTFPPLAPTQEHTLALFFGGSNNGEATFVPTVPAGYTELKWAQGDFQPLFSFSKSNPAKGTATGIYSVTVAGQRPSLMTYDPGTGPVLLNEAAATTTPAEGNWSYNEGGVVYVHLPGGLNPNTEATVEAAVSNLINSEGVNCRISGVELRHGLDYLARFRRRGFTLADFKAQFCSTIGNGGAIKGWVTEGTGFSRMTRGEFANNLNDGIWFSAFKDFEIDFIRGEKFDTVERQNGQSLTADLIQLDLNNGGNVGRLWIHDIHSDQHSTKSGKGNVICHGDGDPVAPKEGEVIVERVVAIGGNFGATAGVPGIKIRDCFFFYVGQKVNWGAGVTSNEIDGHISGIELADLVVVGPALNGLNMGNGIAFEDGTSYQSGVNIHDNLFVNCGYSFMTLNSAELDGVIERNRMAIIDGAAGPSHDHISVKHGPGAGKSLAIDNNVYPTEYANAFRGPAAVYPTIAEWRAATGFDVHSKVEALTEATVKAEIEEKLGRLSARSLGRKLTYAELKALVS